MSNTKLKSAQELKQLLTDRSAGAYENVRALFDEATFVELGAFVKRATTEFDCKGDLNSEFEGVITGYGAIDGRLVFAFVQDVSRMKGAVGEAQSKKICHLYDTAMKNGAPVIGIFASAGAKVLEGVDALSGYAKIAKQVTKASGVIPQIAIISDVCAGMAATIASMYDFVIGAKDSGKLYVTAPYAAKQATKNETIGSIESAFASGMISLIADNTADAIAQTRKLINYLPANNAEGTVYAMITDDADRQTDVLQTVLESENYDVKDVLLQLSDNGQYLELQADYGSAIVTAFAQINGMIVGVCATNPAQDAGKITATAAEKTAKFLSFCDCYRIPVLTLVDSEGLEAEDVAMASALGHLTAAYASSVNAKVTMITGKAYGSVFGMLGSKALGADLVFAADCAKISIMAPEAAVEFLYADQIKGATDTAKAKEEALEEWNSLYASPLTAARNGDIDDIIDYAEMRQRIAAAFEMLSAKQDGAITRLHTTFGL